MVSQNSHQEPSILHQFTTSYSMTGQPHGLGFHSFGQPQITHTRHVMDDLLRAQKLSPPWQTSLNQITSAINPAFVNQMGMCGCISSSPTSSISIFSGTGESFLTQSKYLRPAQLLLHEMVSLAEKPSHSGCSEKYIKRLSRHGKKGSFRLRSVLSVEFLDNDKIVELIALLEGVESGYEKYYHEMEEIVTSFEAIAGVGAGKSYTALALQAMSRHFCNLREAIFSQIKKVVGEISEDKTQKFDTREVRIQRVFLQQLGAVQSLRQSWGQIRGLPGTSVAILRAWLFEHFLHPYPDDLEKLMLASQTGLTKNQVSNWFINARVRLWKPMIEELYRKEFADASEESTITKQAAAITYSAVE
ncbi:unnamed protein product [Cuscuta epithymum]|uniref:Homeobox domain-containing protein n=2 Tax=Cuscuta epithymum TaxID=186058 RepID=A0AAV0C4H8_9ASTE|nr:unnamed protein product [Cuscuta epithymum]